jgi:hypothetical protein
VAHSIAVTDIETLVERCLAEQSDDAWDEAVSLSDHPELAWQFVRLAAARATRLSQFERIAAGPLDYVWRANTNIDRASPALVNVVVAVDRRSRLAAHVMNLAHAAAHGKPRPADFAYAPKPELAALIRPGAHSMTETMLVPSWNALRIAPPPEKPYSAAEFAELLDTYVDEDEWWWALDDLLSDSPRQAWDALLALIARDDVDLGTIGAGPLETLLSNSADRLKDELRDALQSNAQFVRAFSSCYLFSLSEPLLIALAQLHFRRSSSS